MINKVFDFLNLANTLLWYIGIFVILFVGLYLSFFSKFFQIRTLIRLKNHVRDLRLSAGKDKAGTHPLKLYFASVSGMVGLGNIVTVVTTVVIGGPGSLIWLWIASFLGMLAKYSEIYLGVKYRVKNKENGFDGGPMYYLRFAFKSKFLPIVVSLLLCVYGAEVSQFLILTDTLVSTFSFNKFFAIGLILVLVLLSAVKGVKSLANICSTMMPPFMIVYICLGLWVIFDNAAQLPDIFSLVFNSFIEVFKNPIQSSVLLAAQYGISRAVYSGDIGIGYDSIIQSETQAKNPAKQARMAIFALFTDSFICSISILILLTTGVWQIDGIQPSEYVVTALSSYIPYVNYFMALLFISAGFTTVVGYLVVGQKCAKYLSHKHGKKIYILYSIFAFIFFSFYDQEQVILIMSISGGILMTINMIGVFRMRKEIKFN